MFIAMRINTNSDSSKRLPQKFIMCQMIFAEIRQLACIMNIPEQNSLRKKVNGERAMCPAKMFQRILI